MLFPNSAKRAIAEAFYDKPVEALTTTETFDSEGGVIKNDSAVKSTFNGNVRFNALGQVQTELGLTMNIDVAITCPVGMDVQVDDILRYQGVKYVTRDVVPYDSHLMIVGQKWQKSK